MSGTSCSARVAALVRRAPPRGLALLAGLWLAACLPSTGTEPGPAYLIVDSPNGAEGGAVLETASDNIRNVIMNEGFARGRRASTLTRIVLVRNVPGDLRATLQLADLNSLPQFTLIQVADGANQERADLSGYTVRVEPVEDR